MSGPSQWAIARPVGTTLLALALFVAGSLAFMRLPVAPLPKVDMPMIMVQAALPGASPETMASSVATPLERRFGRISGLDELTSSSSMGVTQLALQFSLDRDVEGAARDAQAAIMASAGDLPSNLPSQPIVRKLNPSDAPIIIFAVTSRQHTLGEIYDVANSVIAPKMAQVRGVGQVTVAGGQQPAVRVQVNPAVLAHHQLTASDVAQTITSTNAALPHGKLWGASNNGVLTINDQLFVAQDYQGLPIASGFSSATFADVAHVQDDVENNRVAAWLDGRRAIMLFVRRQANANIIETIAQVQSTLPALQASLPHGFHIDTALDRSATITAAVRDVEWTLIITVVCVVLVVWIFLGSIQATLIPAAAVPLSLVGTFAAMKLMGFSLNNLSLMALTLSTGFVVDDAIVVTENIARRLSLGETRLEAALHGAQEIVFTVVSMTVSLLAVFIPLLFMGGVVGRMFHEFAWTLGLAVLMSLLVSLTVTPMMCAFLLPHQGHPRASERGLTARFNEGFEWLAGRYEQLLHKAVAAPKTMAFVTLLTALATAAGLTTMPKGLFPEQDTGMLMGFTEGPQDVSFSALQKRQQEVARIIGEDQAVSHVISSLGAGGPGGASQSTGNLFVGLHNSGAKRPSAQAVMNRLRPKLAAVPGIQTYLQAVQDVRMGGRGTHSQYQYAVHAQSVSQLRTWAPKMMVALQALPELKDVATDQQSRGLEVRLSVDRDRAARLGVAPTAIDEALYNAFGQRQVVTVFAPNNAYHVVLENEATCRQHPTDVTNLFVRGTSAVPVPMDGLGDLTMSHVPLSVNHEGQFAATTLSFNLAPHVALGQAVQAIDRARSALNMPSSVTAAFAGSAQAYASTTSKQPMLILLALAVVYVVLGVLYEHAWHPITILSTLPSAGLGAVLALTLCGIEMNLIAFVGIILLIGIVKKNAIMMIDVAVGLSHQNVPPKQAIVRACMLRFRPIMMTTAAALLGALPLALGQGSGSELRRPLGVAIVGGLVVSQLLTLFTTPGIYLVLEALAVGARRIFGVVPTK